MKEAMWNLEGTNNYEQNVHIVADSSSNISGRRIKSLEEQTFILWMLFLKNCIHAFWGRHEDSLARMRNLCHLHCKPQRKDEKLEGIEEFCQLPYYLCGTLNHIINIENTDNSSEPNQVMQWPQITHKKHSLWNHAIQGAQYIWEKQSWIMLSIYLFSYWLSSLREVRGL
jgi:hypothetical protein